MDKGEHPIASLLPRVMDELASSKDLGIVSCYNPGTGSDRPTVLLSSSSVYSCLDSNNRVREVPFREDMPLTIPSTFSCSEQIKWISGEVTSLELYPNNILLRICNPYGPNINSLVSDIQRTFYRGEEFTIHHSPYRKKAFIHEDDLVEALVKVLSLFSQGLRGVYNIGGSEIITIQNLADTIYGCMYPKTPKPAFNVTEVKRFCNFYEAVDTTRLQALTKWEPKLSVRKGIWMDVCKRAMLY